MSFNGSGTYTLPSNSWNPAATGTAILAADWNTTATDLATALTTTICKDGQSTTTAKIPFAANISVGVAGSTLGAIDLKGSTSGTTVLAASATASGTLTLPAATDTLVGKATTDELTNKTLTAAVCKGTWTASGTWTLPAHTLGGTVALNGQSFSGTCANGGTVTTIDINGGTVDGAVIGGTSPAAGSFTTLNSTSAATLGDAAADNHVFNGNYTRPSGDMFRARNSAEDANVTGDGTAVDIVCDTETYDRASTYNSATGVHTAAVSGVYNYSGSVAIRGLLSTHTSGFFELITSNETIRIYFGDPYSDSDKSNTEATMPFSVDCFMDAADTAKVNITVANGTKVVDVATRTYFAGRLVG